jgi:hypothetical protein
MTKYEYHYSVAGHGCIAFPNDMLRYDRARIVAVNKREHIMVYDIIGQVTPTTGRWGSFLWGVSEVKKLPRPERVVMSFTDKELDIIASAVGNYEPISPTVDELTAIAELYAHIKRAIG